MFRSQVFPFLINCRILCPIFLLVVNLFIDVGVPYRLRNLLFSLDNISLSIFYKVYLLICWWTFFTIVKGYLNF